MSKYTTEVRYICEVTAGLTDSVGFNSIDSVLEKSVDKIFDFDYPIFDEAYRRPLNKKILRHFYTREIGEETVGLWKLRLQQTLEEVMPYYNKLYETDVMNLNPYYNIDLTTTRNKTGDKTGTSNGTSYNDTNKSGNVSEYGQGNKHKTGTDSDNFTNTIDRTNNGTDTVTKTISGKTTEKDVKTGKFNEKHLGSEAGEKKGTSNKTTTLNEVTNSTDRYSDTPQGALSGMQAIDGNMYLTNARLINTPHSATTTEVGNTKENYKGSDNYTNNGTNSETVNKTGTKAETDKQTGTNKNTIKETGKKTGTKTLNETTTDSNNKNTTENVNTRSNGNTSKTDRINSTEDYLEHVVGYKGNKSYAELLLEYRKSFLNIDRMILKDLDDCFMQLW